MSLDTLNAYKAEKSQISMPSTKDAVLALTLLFSTSACELIAAVDRSKIEEEGAGGTTSSEVGGGGIGGTGGVEDGGGGTGGVGGAGGMETGGGGAGGGCSMEGQTCETGVGECKSVGEFECQNGVDVCNAIAGTPSTDFCDGLDNDCNGVDDDGNNSLNGDPTCSSHLAFPASPGALRKLFHRDENNNFVSMGSYGTSNVCGEIGVSAPISTAGEHYLYYIGDDNIPVTFEAWNLNLDANWEPGSNSCPSLASLEADYDDDPTDLSSFTLPAPVACDAPNDMNPDCKQYTIDPLSVVSAGEELSGAIIATGVQAQ